MSSILNGISEAKRSPEPDYNDPSWDEKVSNVGQKAKQAELLKSKGKEPRTRWNPETKKYYVDFSDDDVQKESVGLPYPGTYEETNDMFKSSGQRRIGTLTTEDEQIDGMAQGEIREIIKNAIHIKNQLDKGVSLDGWMYSYVTTSNDHLNSVAEQINNPNIDEQGVAEEQLDELSCWSGYHRVSGTKAGFPGSCAKNKTNEELDIEEDRENFNGINLLLQKDDEEVFVKASAGSRELGHVLFVMDGDYLMPQDLEVEEKYRGQGIAQTMYDFVKSKGYKIRRSGQQTDAGAGFWAKHRPEQNVWEEKHSKSCPHCGGEMVSEELMNEKKDACYYKVKSRYKVWPSAYASGALVKCRKKGADSWGNSSKNESSILEGLEQVDENLHQWFKEKWVRFGPDGKIRGDCARGDDSEGKPKCLPQSKAQNLGKKGRASAAARKRREDPNPERSGKAINVNTKKKTDEEQVDEGWFKNTLAGAALAGAALTGAGHAQAADLSQFGTPYLQQVASGQHPRPMVNVDDAKAELQAREQGKQQTVAPAAAPETTSGVSIDYLKKAADPDRTGRYLISVEKAQEMLKQATAPRARPALNIAPGDYPAAK
jgi:hypothetical protein